MDILALRPPPGGPILPEKPVAPDATREIAEEFEAVFLSELLAPVFERLETDQIGGGGAGERAFRPLLVQEYAKAIAKSGGVGVADMVARELLRLQTETSDG